MNVIREDARTIKRNFIKSKYIEVAKSIILHHGVKEITARRIAKSTGYSYATIYHYFEDLNDLLLETKLEMINDLVTANTVQLLDSRDPLEKMKTQARIGAEIFFENPYLFEFFYLYRMDEKNAKVMRSLELEKAYYHDILPFVKSGVISEEQIPAISRTITYAVFGAVTIFLSNNGLTKEEALSDIDNTIELLLKRR